MQPLSAKTAAAPGVELVAVTASDGAQMEARWFAAQEPRAALLWLPAMGVGARSYDRLAAQLANMGVAVMVGENRGGASSSVQPRRGVDFGYAELLADFAQLHDLVLARASGLPVLLGGHSLGGQLSLMLLNRLATPKPKVVLVASGTVHHPAFPFPMNLKVRLGTQVSAAVATALGYFPGHRLGFGGLQPKQLILDWAHVGRSGRYTANGRDLEAGLAEREPQLLAVHIQGDTLAPSSATHGLLAKVPRAQATHAEIAPPAEPARLDPHFRWMRGPEPVAEAIARFAAE